MPYSCTRPTAAHGLRLHKARSHTRFTVTQGPQLHMAYSCTSPQLRKAHNHPQLTVTYSPHFINCKYEFLKAGRTFKCILMNAVKDFYNYSLSSVTAVAQWLRRCATNRKVAGSILVGVIGFFHWHNPSDRTMALGSTQTLTEMSTTSISWG